MIHSKTTEAWHIVFVAALANVNIRYDIPTAWKNGSLRYWQFCRLLRVSRLFDTSSLPKRKL